MSRRFPLLPAVVAAIIVVSILTGCGRGPASALQLTSADSGSTQQLSRGQEMVITLDANPTTGYQWSIDGSLPPQLKMVGEPKYSSESSAIGAGGTEVWTFAAQGAGTGTLRLKYWRTFEPTATPAESFDTQVTVE